MTTTATTKQFAPAEAVEVHIQMTNRLYVLVAWANPQGVVGVSLRVNNTGTPEALSNLQSKAVFPGKVVPGWQQQVIDFAAAGLGTVTEVR